MNVNPERPDHPVFRGLDRHRLALWSDYTGWDQTKPGFPRVYPVTAGFKLSQPEALARTAILADYDRGLEGVALCEMFDGNGSVILSGFDLVNRAGLDPAADRLLANLVAYTAAKAGHPVHPLIEQPILWGNFPTERGVVCGSLNGLLVNAEWLAPPPIPPRRRCRRTPAPGTWTRARNSCPAAATLWPLRLLHRLQPERPRPGLQGRLGRLLGQPPAGKKTVLTNVKNPASSPGRTDRCHQRPGRHRPGHHPRGPDPGTPLPLPAGATNVAVRYTGTKTLVLLETRFDERPSGGARSDQAQASQSCNPATIFALSSHAGGLKACEI